VSTCDLRASQVFYCECVPLQRWQQVKDRTGGECAFALNARARTQLEAGRQRLICNFGESTQNEKNHEIFFPFLVSRTRRSGARRSVWGMFKKRGYTKSMQDTRRRQRARFLHEGGAKSKGEQPMRTSASSAWDSNLAWSHGSTDERSNASASPGRPVFHSKGRCDS